MLFEVIRLALQAIRRNILRSFLTVLGIVIGVAAVIAMVTIGNGTTAKVAADLAKTYRIAPARHRPTPPSHATAQCTTCRSHRPPRACTASMWCSSARAPAASDTLWSAVITSNLR